MHLARALKGRGEFQEALDVLDAAEEMSADQGRAIRVYKEEVIKAMKEHMLSFSKAKQFCDKNQMDLDDEEPEKSGKSKAMKEDEKEANVKKDNNSSEKPSKKEKTSNKEKSDKESLSYQDLQERCDKAKTTLKAAEELWTNVKEGKISSEEERLEGLKKMADLVGGNLQTF